MKQADKFTLSREEEALDEIKRTQIKRSEAQAAITLFMFFLIIVPAVQLFVSIPAFEMPRKVEGKGIDYVWEYNKQLIDQKERWESSLEEQSFLQEFFPVPFQRFLTQVLHTGNEKAIVGKEDWLFYENDIRYYQTPINFNSVACIIDFANQLKERGIKLLLMPIPLKPAYHPAMLSGRYPDGKRLQHPDYARWKAELQSAGISFATLPETISYLREDTHWDAASMEKAAGYLANDIQSYATVETGTTNYTVENKKICQRGDIYSMLRLQESLPWGEPQTVEIHPVLNERGEGCLPSRESPVLLLGDSFSNIYSLQGLGWGSGAGLAEQLSFRLQMPIDAIRRNDAGSIATRKILQNELKRGRDRLNGKQIVIWEFAERELSFGEWEKLDMTLGTPEPSSFITLHSGDSLTVQGTILERSASPMPDKVTYADHVIALHLTDLRRTSGDSIPGEAVVYTMGMKNRELTPEAFLRAGDRIQITLKSWQDNEMQYGGFNRNELDDIELQLQEPVWGEKIRRID